MPSSLIIFVIYLFTFLPGFSPIYLDLLSFLITLVYIPLFAIFFVVITISLSSISIIHNDFQLLPQLSEYFSMFRFLLIPGYFVFMQEKFFHTKALMHLLFLLFAVVFVEVIFFIDRSFYLSIIEYLYLGNVDFMSSVPGFRALGGDRVSLIFYQPMTFSLLGLLSIALGLRLGNGLYVILGFVVVLVSGSSSIILLPLLLISSILDKYNFIYILRKPFFNYIYICLFFSVSIVFLSLHFPLDIFDHITSGRYNVDGNIYPVFHSLQLNEMLLGGVDIFTNHSRFLGDSIYTMNLFLGGIFSLIVYLFSLIVLFRWLFRRNCKSWLFFSFSLILIFFDVGGFGASSPKLTFLLAFTFFIISNKSADRLRFINA